MVHVYLRDNNVIKLCLSCLSHTRFIWMLVGLDQQRQEDYQQRRPASQRDGSHPGAYNGETKYLFFLNSHFEDVPVIHFHSKEKGKNIIFFCVLCNYISNCQCK